MQSLHRSERDREVLDRESRRVEDSDVTVGAPTLRSTYKNVTELGHAVTVEHARLHREHEVAVVTSLLPVVGVDASPAGCSLGITFLPVVAGSPVVTT